MKGYKTVLVLFNIIVKPLSDGKKTSRAMPQLRQLVTGFPLWQPEYSPRSGHVGFVVGQIDNGAGFL
jgi:hypothetical protein